MARAAIDQLIEQDQVLAKVGVQVADLAPEKVWEERRKLKNSARALGCRIVNLFGPRDTRYYADEIQVLIDQRTQTA